MSIFYKQAITIYVGSYFWVCIAIILFFFEVVVIIVIKKIHFEILNSFYARNVSELNCLWSSFYLLTIT